LSKQVEILKAEKENAYALMEKLIEECLAKEMVLKEEATGILAKFEEDKENLDEAKSSLQGREGKMKEELGKANHQPEVEAKGGAATADHDWLISEGFKHVVSNLHRSAEYLSGLASVQKVAHAVGLFTGLRVAYHYCTKGRPIESVPYYHPDVQNKFKETVNSFEAKEYQYLAYLTDGVDKPL
jgi:hypothetical protein